MTKKSTSLEVPVSNLSPSLCLQICSYFFSFTLIKFSLGMDFTIIPLLYKSYIYLLSQTCKPNVTGQFFDSGLRLGKGKSHTPDNFMCSTLSLGGKKSTSFVRVFIFKEQNCSQGEKVCKECELLRRIMPHQKIPSSTFFEVFIMCVLELFLITHRSQ